jgi:hypothetical protein
MIPLTGIGAVFLLINIAMILMLPKRWAAMPLLVGACYMTLGQGIQIGPFHFPVIRMIVLSGITRVILRGEKPTNGLNGMDYLIVAWSLWAVVSSAFHKEPSSALVFNLGLIFNVSGIYFLFRIFCETQENVVQLCRMTIIVLVPIAIEMVYEKLAVHNLFSILGGIQSSPDIRNGSIRAQGPFAHSILGGTVGAVCLPLAVGLWSQFRTVSIIGIVACLIIIFTSASSGPLMSGVFAIAALSLWSYRHLVPMLRRASVVGYIIADLVMKVPAYYLIARIDLTGSSTSWHRARLIESAIEHVGEWWLGGTDYTRHWMPTGVSWSPDHTDITNHYIQMGVIGGMPLMLLFIATLWKGFSFVGQGLRNNSDGSKTSQFFLWALGASLFAHATTSISVSYFDQSFIFLYLTLAAISTFYGAKFNTQSEPNIPEIVNKNRVVYSRPKKTVTLKTNKSTMPA